MRWPAGWPRPRRAGAGVKLPGLGGWNDDPLWAYVLRLDRRAPARRRRALAGRHAERPAACSTTPPTRSAGSPPARGSSTSRAAAGSRCAACGPARASRTSPPTSPRPCSTAPSDAARERGVDDQVEPRIADVGDLPFADGSFDLVVSFTGLHCFPDPARAVIEMVRVLRPGGVLTGSAVLNDTGLRYEPMRRIGRLAGLLGPGCTGAELRALAGRPGHHRRRRSSAAARSATSAGSRAELRQARIPATGFSSSGRDIPDSATRVPGVPVVSAALGP